VAVKSFYGRTKVRLADFRSVRGELGRVYRACVARELTWDDGRAAAVILARIGAMDEAAGFEARLAALETALAERDAGLAHRNGNGHGHDHYAPRV
jgi:hypothetical protein